MRARRGPWRSWPGPRTRPGTWSCRNISSSWKPPRGRARIVRMRQHKTIYEQTNTTTIGEAQIAKDDSSRNSQRSRSFVGPAGNGPAVVTEAGRLSGAAGPAKTDTMETRVAAGRADEHPGFLEFPGPRRPAGTRSEPPGGARVAVGASRLCWAPPGAKNLGGAAGEQACGPWDPADREDACKSSKVGRPQWSGRSGGRFAGGSFSRSTRPSKASANADAAGGSASSVHRSL